VLPPEPERRPPALWAWILIWALLIPAALILRPLLPIDETRYLSVAWEMWRRHDWLVPYLNGIPYSDKPPLFFWSILVGWKLFGVNQWWPRLLSPLYSFISILLLYRLVLRLAPGRRAAAMDSLPYLSGLLWITYSTLVLFDTLLTVWVLLAVTAVVVAWQGHALRGWLVYGAAIGLGILTKGPVMLVYALPVAALAPWWAKLPRSVWLRWFAALLAALVLGAAIALSWALPAGARGGPTYQSAILWQQTAGRVMNAFAHRRPWWWYLPLLPVLLFPWSVWPPVWRSLVAGSNSSPNTTARFALAWVGAGFVLLSLISGKQVHYLLPLLPGLALLIGDRLRRDSARSRWDMAPAALILALLGVMLLIQRSSGRTAWAADFSPILGVTLVLWGLTLLSARGRYPQVLALALTCPVLVLCLHLTGQKLVHRRFDLMPAAVFLQQAERSGRPLAYLGSYQGEFHFLGRLERPFIEVEPDGLADWARHNFTALLIRPEHRPDNDPVLRRWRYRDGFIAIQAATSLAPSPP
jgi:4-amino-4-deoxy-L-arabinose transferase-like glycosyltransferase